MTEQQSEFIKELLVKSYYNTMYLRPQKPVKESIDNIYRMIDKFVDKYRGSDQNTYSDDSDLVSL